MLRQSFIFLPCIGPKREQDIWRAGITDWDSFLQSRHVPGISARKKLFYDKLLREARSMRYDACALARLLPTREHYRLWNVFRDEALYLDIETDGYRNGVTVIGMYDGFQTKTMTRGINLDKKLLQRELSRSKILVTFNGLSFDMPVLQKYFGIDCRLPHIDLRGVCSRIGLTGGLKRIERLLGIEREDRARAMSGSDAITCYHLWRQTGDEEALARLVAYNEEDTINLKTLADHAISSLWARIHP